MEKRVRTETQAWMGGSFLARHSRYAWIMQIHRFGDVGNSKCVVRPVPNAFPSNPVQKARVFLWPFSRRDIIMTTAFSITRATQCGWIFQCWKFIFERQGRIKPKCTFCRRAFFFCRINSHVEVDQSDAIKKATKKNSYFRQCHSEKNDDVKSNINVDIKNNESNVLKVFPIFRAFEQNVGRWTVKMFDDESVKQYKERIRLGAENERREKSFIRLHDIGNLAVWTPSLLAID